MCLTINNAKKNLKPVLKGEEEEKGGGPGGRGQGIKVVEGEGGRGRGKGEGGMGKGEGGRGKGEGGRIIIQMNFWSWIRTFMEKAIQEHGRKLIGSN